MMAIAIISTVGITSAYAVSKTSSFSPQQSVTSHSCGTNFTDGNEYACSVAYSTGYMFPLAKVKGTVPTTTATSDTRLNAEQDGSYSAGSTPELTTSASTVTFTSKWDLEGTIYRQTPSWQLAYLFYGHEIYKKNWLGGWDEVTDCREGKYANFDNIETVSCTISNSGTNTYRIGALVEALAQDNSLTDDVVYVDFYTGNNHVKLTELSIT